MTIRHRHTTLWVVAALIAAVFFIYPYNADAYAADNGIPDDYEPHIYNDVPAQQFKDVFETETVEVSGITVTSGNGYVSIFDKNDTIHFRIFNSTTQETEYEIDTINNMDGTHTLPTMELKKNHNYIFFVEDPMYQLGSKKYVHIMDEGPGMQGAFDYKYKNSSGEYNKEYVLLTDITVYRRESEVSDPREEARCNIGSTAMPVLVTYGNSPVHENLRFRFESDLETLTGTTDDSGHLQAALYEDITYMVYLDSDKYAMEPFPIVVKDKSEYGEGRYAYNHSTCTRVDEQHPIRLYDTAEEARNNYDFGDPVMSVTSLKGRVAVRGMNFRHLVILDRELDKSLVSGMDGKDYEVIGITAVNPHRWEISKLIGTDFTVTKKIERNKLVSHVYYIDEDGVLRETDFEQKSADRFNFTMNSLSLYPVVIEYDQDKTYEEAEAAEKAAREEAEREKAAQEKAAREKAEREKAAQEKAAQEKAAREKAAKEKAAQEKAEQERKAKEAAWKGVVDKKYPALSKVKAVAGKKKATVKWKKLTAKQLRKAGKVKIEVQYSLSKKFPMSSTRSKYAGRKKTSVKIGSLKSGRTYYARVRTVRTIQGVKHVSKWSKVRKVKVR